MQKMWLSLGLLSSVPFLTHAYCIDDWACFDKISNKQKVEYWLRNNKPYPITSTLEVTTRNLHSTDKKRVHYSETRVLGPFERVKVLSLSVFDPLRSTRIKENFFWTPGIQNAAHDDSYRYALPYSANHSFRLVQGVNGGFSHHGASRYAYDYAMPVGTPVHAARNGQVIDLQQKHNKGGASRRYSRFANFVTILHTDGTTGEYYHLQQYGVKVTLGEHVTRGQLIGYSGNTGFSSLPHLHFAVYQAKSHGKYQSLPINFVSSQP
ncbi:M23 family metallopeptidase [Paraglaciecola polaris]|uniref:Peptidase M23B n=1 Tax=Paraglaciecola polaris LMG 21857 TaxID=1129793 RepID=K6Z5C0_9ALTE|nr:M23 family metallopeptidase [Paraglaciecola polaris]GAC31381.1 peptidase M23B [Paraglaciecola polaris LMG 21857]